MIMMMMMMMMMMITINLNRWELCQPGDAEVDKPNNSILAPSQIRKYQVHAPQLNVCILQRKDITSGVHLEHASKWVTQKAQMMHNKKNITI